ncbi:UBN2_2 domain-containing protein, partial [Tanacetum coccineum]
MKNSISIAIRGAIPDSENAKEFLKSWGVREHIMMMNNMASKLKGIDMEISEGFLVHFIMTSLPAQFGPFKINYNMQKKKWKMSNKGSKWEKRNSDKEHSSNGKESSPKCRFCKKPVHFQKECPKFREWLDKK